MSNVKYVNIIVNPSLMGPVFDDEFNVMPSVTNPGMYMYM